MQFQALILGGGQSRRMGRDKLSLPLTSCGGVTVFQHVVSVLHTRVKHVSIVTSPAGPPPDIGGGVSTVVDTSLFKGPLAALQNSWGKVVGRESCDGCFVVAGDLPGLASTVLAELEAMYSASRDVDAVVVVREGKLQPLLGVYSTSAGVAWDAAVARGETRLMAAMECLRIRCVDAAAMGWPDWWTRPIHTPEDYKLWLESGGEQ